MTPDMGIQYWLILVKASALTIVTTLQPHCYGRMADLFGYPERKCEGFEVDFQLKPKSIHVLYVCT